MEAKPTGGPRPRKRSAEAVSDNNSAVAATTLPDHSSAELGKASAEHANAPAEPAKKRRRMVPRVPAGQLPTMTQDHFTQAAADKVVFAKVDGWPAYPAQVSVSSIA